MIDTMSEIRLNAKLQEWAEDPTYSVYTDSLDACFKWLVPKLRHWEVENWDCVGYTAFAGIERGNYKVAKAETPALALCLAIEKLIDGEVKE